MASVFKANAQGSHIHGVGFYCETPGTKYTIYIYDKVYTAGQLYSPIVHPTQGTLVYQSAEGTAPVAGFHIIPIPSTKVTVGIPPSVANFSVVVKLTSQGCNWPIAVEDAEPNFSSRATVIPGQSFISQDGITWYDGNTYSPPMKACLKAYANKN
jgi:hypothetical protein